MHIVQIIYIYIFHFLNSTTTSNRQVTSIRTLKKLARKMEYVLKKGRRRAIYIYTIDSHYSNNSIYVLLFVCSVVIRTTFRCLHTIYYKLQRKYNVFRRDKHCVPLGLNVIVSIQCEAENGIAMARKRRRVVLTIENLKKVVKVRRN